MLDRVDLDSCVRTDGWRAYNGLEEEGYEHEPEIQQATEDASENLPWVHVVFSNLKRVIKGTHGKADEAKFQGYLDRFNDRFNWRARLGRGLELGLEGLVNTEQVTRKQIREEDLTVNLHSNSRRSTSLNPGFTGSQLESAFDTGVLR